MDDYRTAQCASCRQAFYLAAHKLKEPFWTCPGCGAENMALGTVKRVSVSLPPSRFARKNPRGTSPVVHRRHKKVSLIRRLTGRTGAS